MNNIFHEYIVCFTAFLARDGNLEWK